MAGKVTAERIREKIGHPMLMNHRPGYNRAVAAARIASGENAFVRAWSEGRDMSLEDAVEYALSGEGMPQHH